MAPPIATTRFLPLLNVVQGFDYTPGNTTIPLESWQMVPIGGSRPVLLTKGNDLDLVLSNVGGGPSVVATFHEVITPTSAAKREIWIAGQRLGSAVLNANNRSTGMTEARLQIGVLPNRAVTLSFFCVVDEKGRTTKTLNCSSIQRVLERANSIWEMQANISLSRLHCRSPWIVKADLGEEVDAHKSFPFMDPAQFSGDFNVFLVWAVENPSSGGIDVLAVTRNDRCIFEENIGDSGTNDAGEALAHEIGHFLGLGHSTESNLMYKQGGTDQLAKYQILKAQERLGRTPKRPPIFYGPWGF